MDEVIWLNLPRTPRREKGGGFSRYVMGYGVQMRGYS
jgi:hypothetical protein